MCQVPIGKDDITMLRPLVSGAGHTSTPVSEEASANSSAALA